MVGITVTGTTIMMGVITTIPITTTGTTAITTSIITKKAENMVEAEGIMAEEAPVVVMAAAEGITIRVLRALPRG